MNKDFYTTRIAMLEAQLDDRQNNNKQADFKSGVTYLIKTKENKILCKILSTDNKFVTVTELKEYELVNSPPNPDALIIKIPTRIIIDIKEWEPFMSASIENSEDSSGFLYGFLWGSGTQVFILLVVWFFAS